MKILVSGSREWTNKEAIKRVLLDYHEWAIMSETKITLIHGGARGADTLAGEVAQKFGWDVEVFKADWETHKKGAGPIRNKLMLEQKPDLVICFTPNILESKGTKNCYLQAVERNFSVVVYNK